ncbi:hypothetical protein GALMADRAFT_142254 [Galerina marginata CBS 339.88]|uniref:Uncharacterized protein n=1 Tax=Galerina marginata (strain CBS 339.88) TaxID=685588 RepID=A0A067SQ82_GALM3|nr:hypothetical protein GALMADRAFT_142254 [Galerina marginata CBS 339.88]
MSTPTPAIININIETKCPLSHLERERIWQAHRTRAIYAQGTRTLGACMCQVRRFAVQPRACMTGSQTRFGRWDTRVFEHGGGLFQNHRTCQPATQAPVAKRKSAVHPPSEAEIIDLSMLDHDDDDSPPPPPSRPKSKPEPKFWDRPNLEHPDPTRTSSACQIPMTTTKLHGGFPARRRGHEGAQAMFASRQSCSCHRLRWERKRREVVEISSGSEDEMVLLPSTVKKGLPNEAGSPLQTPGSKCANGACTGASVSRGATRLSNGVTSKSASGSWFAPASRLGLGGSSSLSQATARKLDGSYFIFTSANTAPASRPTTTFSMSTTTAPRTSTSTASSTAKSSSIPPRLCPFASYSSPGAAPSTASSTSRPQVVPSNQGEKWRRNTQLAIWALMWTWAWIWGHIWIWIICDMQFQHQRQPRPQRQPQSALPICSVPAAESSKLVSTAVAGSKLTAITSGSVLRSAISQHGAGASSVSSSNGSNCNFNCNPST